MVGGGVDRAGSGCGGKACRAAWIEEGVSSSMWVPAVGERGIPPMAGTIP